MLTRSTPAAVGVDARGILAFLDALEALPATRPHGLMVLRSGAVVAEGWWAPYSPDRPQLLYSLSKSFTSTAAGFAVKEGILDLDATVVSYFPEFDHDIQNPRSRAMRVRHIASMASGHTSETLDRAERADPADLVRGFLLVPPEEEPGSVFAYNQPCTYTLAAIIQRQSGQSLVDYLRPRLFDPLGIGEVSWMRWPPHGDLGFSGMFATTEAVARLGELYRLRGMWGDARILDASWVDEATRPHIATPLGWGADWERGYGFQFWIARHGYRGDGAYGQLCVVVPEHELVVALTSETENVQAVLDALWRHVLPAIGGATSAAADAELASRMRELHVPTIPARPEPPTDDWSGRVARTGRARTPGDLTDTVRVDRGRGGWTVALGDDDDPFVVPFMTGSWTLETVAGVPVAANGGWDEQGDLVIDVLFLETPHSARIRCTAAGTAEAAWVTVPLHSSRMRDQRRP